MNAGCDLYSDEDTWNEILNMIVVFKPLVRSLPSIENPKLTLG